MKIETVKISSLKHWDKNPRESIDIERLKNILTKRGQTMPLLVDGRDHSTVLGGNMRLKAMQELGWKECEVSIIIPVDDSDAVNMAMEDNDQFGIYIQDQVIALANEFKIDTEINLSFAPMKLHDLMPSDKNTPNQNNKEIDPDSLDQECRVILKFNQEEYERYLSLIAVIQEKQALNKPEEVVLFLLENGA